MNYFYNICYIKVPNEHIDLKRNVCVILILPLTIPCCEPTNHMCNNVYLLTSIITINLPHMPIFYYCCAYCIAPIYINMHLFMIP